MTLGNGGFECNRLITAFIWKTGGVERNLILVKAPFIAVLLCISTAAIAQDATQIQRYLENLKTGSICQRRAAIIALHRMAKAAIPMLIEHIDDHEVAPSSTLMLASPILSSAPASQKDEFSGVINAYVVELILASATLRDDEKDCTFLLSQGDYAYGWGVIMKDGVRSPSGLTPSKLTFAASCLDSLHD